MIFIRPVKAFEFPNTWGDGNIRNIDRSAQWSSGKQVNEWWQNHGYGRAERLLIVERVDMHKKHGRFVDATHIDYFGILNRAFVEVDGFDYTDTNLSIRYVPIAIWKDAIAQRDEYAYKVHDNVEYARRYSDGSTNLHHHTNTSLFHGFETTHDVINRWREVRNGSMKKVPDQPGHRRYHYRNLPVPSGTDTPWLVSGHDDRLGSSGVLEWCTCEHDANVRLSIMHHTREFSELAAEQWTEGKYA